MKNLLKNKLFLTLFASDLLSNFGDVLYYLALMSYVLQLPDARLAIAIVSLSESLPILTGFVMGYVADRTPDKIGRIVYTLLFRVLMYSLTGLLMGFSPSLWIVVVAATFNFLSDLSGQYENGLYTPLSLRVVSDEDREASLSLKQGIFLVAAIGFQSAGAVLVPLLSYRVLAFINAGTFALSALLFLAVTPRLKILLKERPIAIENTSLGNGLWHDLWLRMKETLSLCLAVSELRQSMIIVPLLNGAFNVISILVAVIISQDQAFVLINPAITLATISLVQLSGGIIGSILGVTVLKNLSIQQSLRLATLLAPLVFFCLYRHWIIGFFIAMFAIMVLAAMINPKMNALILNLLPEEKLASINGGIGTYFQLGGLVSRLVVSGLILILPVDGISLVLACLGLMMVVYMYRGQKSVPLSMM